ncbi:hypothetical protein MKX01_034874 [Papaver californicum]|nr:hypothetical protein MKX01_034874 [Papaver californicum]
MAYQYFAVSGFWQGSVFLRCLRLVSCYKVSDDALINMAKETVLLEDLEISKIILAQPSRDYRRPHIKYDDEALAIAENMPQLPHLHLFGNKLTNVGLRDILNSCLHLESLDPRKCLNVNLDGDLLKSCKDRLIK